MSNDAIQTIQKDNLTCEIHQDDDPMSPREADNMGIMVCFHRRWDLPCEADYRSEGYNGWADMEADIAANGGLCILPIYMLDHSGLAFSVNPFGCQWDSGQVGFIYTTAAKIKECFGVTDITDEVMKRVRANLVSEVEAYHQYSSGDVYGYVIKRFDDTTMEDEVLDSCWGFFGMDYALEEAKSAMESLRA